IAVTADEGLREDISCERRAVEGRGAANTPIQPDTCTVTYMFPGNIRGGRGDERGRKQEIPHRVVVVLPVENEISHQIHWRGGNRIGARNDTASMATLPRVQASSGNGGAWPKRIHSEDRSVELDLSVLRD